MFGGNLFLAPGDYDSAPDIHFHIKVSVIIRGIRLLLNIMIFSMENIVIILYHFDRDKSPTCILQHIVTIY